MTTIDRRRFLAGALGGLVLVTLESLRPLASAAAELVDGRFGAYYAAHEGPRVLGPAITRLEGTAQYFEKGRLEDHRGQGLPCEWEFMYGRLAAELIEAGASIPVAGEAGPTYADLRARANPALRLAPPAWVSGAQPTSGGVFVPVDPALRPAPGYEVPAVFWTYINDARLFPGGWLHDIGLPLTSAFEADARKGEIWRTVTIQAFERTVLTYDPANPADWRVERANIGAHYLAHRSRPANPPVQTFAHWRGDYFDNDHFGGHPVLTRDDQAIDFDWGAGSPGPRVPKDNFTARWTRQLQVAEPTAYRVVTKADDGVRVWVDERLIVDAWSKPDEAEGFVYLEAGRHPVRVEYREQGGSARVRVNLDRIESYPQWKGAYYNTADLSGQPFFIRNDRNIDFDWKDGGPGSGLKRDGFSAQWTRAITVENATYRFTIVADDGARLFVDGKKALDKWDASGRATYTVDVPARAGKRTIRLDFRDRRGAAAVRLTYARLP